ncbi:hypothetical protein BCR33DRAFT_496294 [Rhizoclosmatium globosum]|uniref:Uncharacterized protein n=1 Tax=Rhizoclosmatium globosum TaxID=329046 RepID=A0A1Y2CVH3_9FUNG|nr:hypothetical protein BCR33DRAFT_496294 [Rhizoclosmatium globosum]|eukprot:ORY50814.1 hypothetical protein BCR33DRAFT_496294 [Rhizoclosmatium globosum]
MEITTHALLEAKRMEGGSDDDLIFGGDEKLQSEYWSRVVPRIAEGLVSDISAVRKAAFDCAVAMSTRSWEVASTQFTMKFVKRVVNYGFDCERDVGADIELIYLYYIGEVVVYIKY